MLANIASIEIPPLPQSLVEWLSAESDIRLAYFGIQRTEIDDRAFFPRLVIGEYLATQFSILVDRARSLGITIETQTQTDVTDVQIVGERIRLKVQRLRSDQTSADFDYVILATGHQWPSDPETRPGYFTSPWPASALSRIRNCAVGIRGTSLTAIDACLALADHHGEFHEEDDDVRYQLNTAESDDFSITLFSRKGVLPEADFFHPIPYEALQICTAEAIEELIQEHPAEDLLDAAFALFRKELFLADPGYSGEIGVQSLSLEDFHAAYFDQREHSDPFDWARRNLNEAIVNFDKKSTVPWRYAILRMHEVFGLLAAHLSDADFERFTDTLRPVFVDNYATVPHTSIKRMLALRKAGILSVERLAEGLRVQAHHPGTGVTVRQGKSETHFGAFIEATGQKTMGAKDFPFPSLRRQRAIQDVKSEDGTNADRGIAVDGDYHPISALEGSDRLFCLSLPYLLGQHPFAQGITSSAEMANIVAEAIEKKERAAELTACGRLPLNLASSAQGNL